MRYCLLFMILSSGFAAGASGLAASDPLAQLHEQRQELRRLGPPGLAQALSVYDREAAGLSPARLAELRQTVDWIAGQRHGWQSRLYWHDELSAALAQAAAEKKPVLSLHLLGDLRSAYSCANSRLFRSLLYADPAIATLLRRSYVLHAWSEATVPQVEISFADGRRYRGTITGNSVHYVLSADGRVVDCLPGMYTPSEFQLLLSQARLLSPGLPLSLPVPADNVDGSLPLDPWAALALTLTRERPSSSVPVSDPRLQLERYLSAEAISLLLPPQRSHASVDTNFYSRGAAGEVAEAGEALPEEVRLAAHLNSRATTMTKMAMPFEEPVATAWIDAAAVPAEWANGSYEPLRPSPASSEAAMAVSLSDASQELIALESHPGQSPQQAALQAAALRQSLASDSAFNQRLMRPAALIQLLRTRYLVSPRDPQVELVELNRRIYREVLLTPLDDQASWLPLGSLYSALPAGGLLPEAGSELALDSARQDPEPPR